MKTKNQEEFNLSKKRIAPHKNSVTIFQAFYPDEDVKEFIRLLKEGMPNQDMGEWKSQQEFIDKLAGDKLK